MAKAGAIVLFLCQLSVLFCGIYGFLDMEELKSVNYGIDIENTPVMFKEELPEGAVRLSSKHGQQYQCSYPDKVTKEKQEEKEKIAMETGIPELLKPMEEGPCLHYSQGWWDYEFCYGKHIRQFHMEDGKIRGDVIFLGHYESEYDWNNVSATQANRLNRYHSQRYVNGSLCDLTGNARRTEVRFVCADGQGDYLGRVEEAQSCVYVLTVYTTKICRHPYLKPPSVNRPVTITCSPLLDAEQYQEYLHDQKVSESAIADETADRFSKFPPEAAQYDDSTALTGDGTDESESPKENTFVESLMKGIREMLAENAQEGNKAVLHSDILKSARDISKSIQQRLRQQKDKSAKIERETESSDDEGDDNEDGDDLSGDDLMKRDWQKLRDRLEAIKHKRAEAIAKAEVGRKTLEEGRSREQDRKREGGSEKEKEEEDADVMEEFDKGLQDIAPSAQDKARLASHSDSVRTTLQAQFNNIIEEAQEEMAQEATEDDPAMAVDKGLAYKKLSQTLGALLSRLETAQKDIKDMDNALENMKDESKQQQQEQTQQQQQQQQQAQQQSQQQQQQQQQEMAEDDTVDTEEQDVTASTETPPAADTQKDPTEPVTDGSKERLEDAATEHRVNTMRKRKATKGMQVKFVTLGYYNDDGTIQIISGDDKSSVSKVMVAVLGIGNEAAKEAEKHERLADNYNFVWPKKTGEHDQKQEVTTSQSDQD